MGKRIVRSKKLMGGKRSGHGTLKPHSGPSDVPLSRLSDGKLELMAAGMGKRADMAFTELQKRKQEHQRKLGEFYDSHGISSLVLRDLEKESGGNIESVETEFDHQTATEYFKVETETGEYSVFSSRDEAEALAVSKVKEDLDSDITTFNQEWLSGHFDTDAFLEYLKGGERESIEEGIRHQPEDFLGWYPDITQEDINAYEGKGGDGNANLVEEKIDEMLEARLDDIRYGETGDKSGNAMQYHKDYFGTHDIGRFIDMEKAAKDAVDTDGVGHFLSPYDGQEIELVDDHYAYRLE